MDPWSYMNPWSLWEKLCEGEAKSPEQGHLLITYDHLKAAFRELANDSSPR